MTEMHDEARNSPEESVVSDVDPERIRQMSFWGLCNFLLSVQVLTPDQMEAVQETRQRHTGGVDTVLFEHPRRVMSIMDMDGPRLHEHLGRCPTLSNAELLATLRVGLKPIDSPEFDTFLATEAAAVRAAYVRIFYSPQPTA